MRGVTSVKKYIHNESKVKFRVKILKFYLIWEYSRHYFFSFKNFTHGVCTIGLRTDLMQAYYSLREKCPNTELFLVRIFLYLDWIQKNTDQKLLRIWTLFTQYILQILNSINHWFASKPTAWFLHERNTDCYFFHDGGPYHIETSPLICSENQWAGFYMIRTSVMK